MGGVKLETAWSLAAGDWPFLTDDCSPGDLEDEIELVVATLTDILDQHARVITIYAWSKC